MPCHLRFFLNSHQGNGIKNDFICSKLNNRLLMPFFYSHKAIIKIKNFTLRFVLKDYGLGYEALLQNCQFAKIFFVDIRHR